MASACSECLVRRTGHHAERHIQPVPVVDRAHEEREIRQRLLGVLGTHGLEIPNTETASKRGSTRAPAAGRQAAPGLRHAEPADAAPAYRGGIHRDARPAESVARAGRLRQAQSDPDSRHSSLAARAARACIAPKSALSWNGRQGSRPRVPRQHHKRIRGWRRENVTHRWRSTMLCHMFFFRCC